MRSASTRWLCVAAVSFMLAATWPSTIVAAEPAVDVAVPKGVDVSLALRADEPKSAETSPQSRFDVDPSGFPAVAEGASLKLFGTSRELLSLGVLTIDDFAWMRDGSLLLVTQGHLEALSASGIELGPTLPGPGMRVRPAGPDTAYVFGGASEPSNRDIYLLTQDEQVLKLASLPVPVTAIAGDGKTSYAAAGRSILRISLDQPPQVVLDARDPVIDMDLAASGGVFFSTKSAVGYLGSNGGAYEFIRGDGGLVRVRGSHVFILMSSGNLLRVGPIERFESVTADGSADELPSGRDGEVVGSVRYVQEIKDRLYELNYDPDFDSSAIDERTRDAIRDFEKAGNAPAKGEATYGLLKRLRAANARKPWGSIVYDKDADRFGLGWGHQSRKASVQSARERCGTDMKCTIEVSFTGEECGAFAYSKAGWSLAARQNIEWAREAALGECRKRDKNCSIIAAVCADGSNRFVVGGVQ